MISQVEADADEPSLDVSDASTLGAVLKLQLDADHGDQAHTPALPVLESQQEDLKEMLRQGVESRRDLLMLTHVASAVSAGHVPNAWFKDVLNDRWTVAACLADEEARKSLCAHPPSESEAMSKRTDIIQKTLSPSFDSALTNLRQHAADFIDEDDGIDHVDRQRFLALRPRLHQFAVKQHTALRWAFGDAEDHDPIQTRADALEWANKVSAGCGRYLTGFASEVANPVKNWWPALMLDGDQYLVTLLAERVLPAMNQLLRTAAFEADELPTRPAPAAGGGNIS